MLTTTAREQKATQFDEKLEPKARIPIALVLLRLLVASDGDDDGGHIRERRLQQHNEQVRLVLHEQLAQLPHTAATAHDNTISWQVASGAVRLVPHSSRLAN